jgi:hypothetical protein
MAYDLPSLAAMRIKAITIPPDQKRAYAEYRFFFAIARDG